MDESVIEHKLDDLRVSVEEIKADVKAIKDEAPIHRITSLETWRTNVNRFLASGALAILGAWAVVLLR